MTVAATTGAGHISSWARQQALAIAIWVADALPTPHSPVRVTAIGLGMSNKPEAWKSSEEQYIVHGTWYVERSKTIKPGLIYGPRFCASIY